jgi:hypothetical protein
MKLKLSELASIAEVIGAVAVVISLIYVGAQVRDTNRAVRSAAINDATIAVQSWYQMMSSDPAGIDAWLNSALNAEAPPRNEEFRFQMQLQALMYAIQNVFMLSQEGAIDLEFRDSMANLIRPGGHTPGFERYWVQRREYFHPEFASFVDEVLAREGPLDSAVEVYQPSADR